MEAKKARGLQAVRSRYFCAEFLPEHRQAQQFFNSLLRRKNWEFGPAPHVKILESMGPCGSNDRPEKIIPGRRDRQ
ncbi:MAG: hypothetical protein JRH05_00285 [Deltaproteobacteria bacterium]|nr:hypothetical protein [Deltaproteobacteria bacterium]